MDIKGKTNNALLALMGSFERESDTYKLAYEEFTQRYLKNISEHGVNTIMGVSSLARDIKEGVQIDDEYWNEECQMGIDEGRVHWYSNHFQNNDRTQTLARL